MRNEICVYSNYVCECQMNLMKEGGSTSHPPLLDGRNYGFWKARMRAFIKSIDEKAWRSVL